MSRELAELSEHSVLEAQKAHNEHFFNQISFFGARQSQFRKFLGRDCYEKGGPDFLKVQFRSRRLKDIEPKDAFKMFIRDKIYKYFIRLLTTDDDDFNELKKNVTWRKIFDSCLHDFSEDSLLGVDDAINEQSLEEIFIEVAKQMESEINEIKDQ